MTIRLFEASVFRPGTRFAIHLKMISGDAPAYITACRLRRLMFATEILLSGQADRMFKVFDNDCHGSM